MRTIKKTWSILLSCVLILVPALSVSAAEKEIEKVEISFFNEDGEAVSVTEEMAESLMEQVGEDKEQGIINETALNGSCSHIPCNQVETALYGHDKINAYECWVYTKRAIVCKCCCAALKSLSFGSLRIHMQQRG